MNEETPKQEPSIKLIRGQRGNYGWEIKILNLNVNEIQRIDNEMRVRFAPDILLDLIDVPKKINEIEEEIKRDRILEKAQEDERDTEQSREGGEE